ncbi:MAG: sulfotransferase [Planctomycetota bacterium]|nr:sulfotransferase [Planctomycetota bacterium]
MLGAHRSGTSLVTRALQAMGAFMGRGLEQNAEPLFFVRRNEWLLRRSGGSWDRPWDAVAALGEGQQRGELLRVLREEIAGRGFAAYQGRLAWAASRLGARSSKPWGWKDPRNAWTAALWSEVFPGARLLCVERNGIDASQSLIQREARSTAAWGAAASGTDAHPDLLLRSPRGTLPFLISGRSWSFEEAFALWEASVEAGRRAAEAHLGPSLFIRFEDLMATPAKVLTSIAGFAGLDPAPSVLDAIARDLSTDRAHAFLEDPGLRERYRTLAGSPWMRALGYGALDHPGLRETPG